MPRSQRHNSGKKQGWNDLAGYNRAPESTTSKTHSKSYTINRDYSPNNDNNDPNFNNHTQNTSQLQQLEDIARSIPANLSDEAAAIRMAILFKERQLNAKGVWEPLPIQVCPKEDDDESWDTWMLRGGRGSGKTEGATRYTLKHLRKYGPKARVGVGGKTAADARDTCAEGDSGLITIAPDEFFYHRSVGEARHKKGGYVKFMGAEEPDRWNGPQWSMLWCVVGDTLVQTEFGNIPIKYINPGMRVWTRNGLRKVTWAGLTRKNTETLKVTTSDGNTLQATPDHPVWIVGKGWVRVDQIQVGDKVEVWMPSNSQNVSNGKTLNGIELKKDITRIEQDICYTSLYGNIPTKCDDRQIALSTIKTRTKETTIQTTLNSNRERNITDFILPENDTARTLGKVILRELKSRGQCDYRETTNALNAELTFNQSDNEQSFAALCAENDITPFINNATVTSVTQASPSDVYDLTVEGSHEFYANNILIHNCDEAGLWPKESFDQAQLGLRLGEFPRTIISTTPKMARWLEAIEKKTTTIHTHGTLRENFHLSEFARRKLLEQYVGTSLERREIEGEWSYESPNALWTEELLNACRVDLHPALYRIVIAIDPAVTSGETSDDTGIIAAGVDSPYKSKARGYILRDRTCHLSPAGWAETAVALYDELQADLIVAEVNNGGDLVETTLQSIRPNLPFKKIHASRGKIVRAQPIVSLYEKSRVFHVSNSLHSLVPLEQEMLSWDPTGYKSPNRMDAAVWALTDLMIADVKSKRNFRIVYNDPVRISAY